MADAICALVLFYSAIFGARRGFYKEVVHALALVIAILLARALRLPVGSAIASATGIPNGVTEVAAVIVVWVVAFLVVAIVGRLILKKLRGKGIDDNLDASAEDIADAIGGDTTKGPLTLLTDPIASKTGIFYWSDKLIGLLLGFVKGVITVTVVFSLVLYVDRARNWNWSFAKSVEESHSARFFAAYLDPYLRTFPEYRILTSLRSMRAIAEDVKEHPGHFVAFGTHAELKGLRSHPKIAELAEDPEVRQAWVARDLKALLLNEKVRELLTDRDLRERIAAVDWDKVRQDVESHKFDAVKDAEALRSIMPAGALPEDADGGDLPDAPSLPE